MKKDEMCNWGCDEMHCSVCQLGVDTNNVQGLHAIEMATIKYKVARYKLDRAKNTCLEIEELLEQARKNLCDMLGDYIKAEKEYRKAMREKYSDLDKANFLEWYKNAGAEEIATAMRHNKGQLEYLKRKYIPDGRTVND